MNGEIALRLICKKYKENNEIFDFVLLDLNMPVMDGLTCIKELRRLEQDY